MFVHIFYFMNLLDTKQETKPPTFPCRRLRLSSLRDAVFCPLARLRRAVLARFRERKFHSVLRY